MDVLVWIAAGSWPSCVEAARKFAPASSHLTLLHVVDDTVAGTAQGALAGLLGRSSRSAGPDRDGIRDLAEEVARELLDAAREAVGRPATTEQRHGRLEREVVAAAEGKDLLVLARDGDLRRLGPHSLNAATRFVVDHAPCPVLLVWPSPPPGIGSIPPPPHEPSRRH
jgi:nucleotide-binding universal stress UspA family protein